MASLSNFNGIVVSDRTLLIKPKLFKVRKLHNKQTPSNLQIISNMKAEESHEQYQTQLQKNSKSNQTTTRRFLVGLAAAVALSAQSGIEKSLAEDNGFSYTGPIPIPPNSMRYKLVNEIEVQASASSIWSVYASKDLPKLIVKLLPEVFQQIDYISGDGGVGTVVHVVFARGSVPQSYSEMFKTIDHVNRVKEVQQVSGGYLAMGVTYYMDRFEIVSTGPNSCIIRSTTEYEVPDHLAAEMNKKISVDGLVTMANAIIKYVQEFGDQVKIDNSPYKAMDV